MVFEISGLDMETGQGALERMTRENAREVYRACKEVAENAASVRAAAALERIADSLAVIAERLEV